VVNVETSGRVPPDAPEPARAGTRSWARHLRTGARRSDLADAVTIFVIGSLLLAVGLDFATTDLVLWGDGPPGGGSFALLTVGCGIISVKRHSPVLALLGGVVLTLVDLSWGGSLAVLLVLWDLLYSATLRSGPRTRTWLWSTAVCLSVVLAVAAGEATRDLRVFVYTGLQLAAILLIPMWWADNVRQKTELAELERARADEAARAAELERRRAADHARLASSQRHEAVQAERAAMARDLHDVIASHLSTIAIHSGATLASPPDAARDRAALEQVRASAVESLTEMRSMIELLRADAPRDPVPAPGRLAGLRTLVDGAVGAGADVALQIDARLDGADAGTAEGSTGATVPAAVGQALHRIAQEALTNARKHAPGEPVAVRLAVDDTSSSLVLTVTSGAGAAAAPPHLDEPALNAGTGLVIMRERAQALGGTFRAGPTTQGEWVVRAEVPLGRGRETGDA
jgi:signal transduction histidine kinase